MKDELCVGFLKWALPRLGMRWEGFRKPRDQVCKRIARRMAELGLESVESYRELLEEDSGEWEVLDGLCRVTISRFCRDRGVYRRLAAEELPELARALDPRGPLRVWSAGCGSGEEPYSVSLVWSFELEARFPDLELRIVATDAGPEVLERARRACYPPGTLKELPDAWVEAAFLRRPEGRDVGEDDPLCLRERYTRPVELRRQDLREEMPAGPFHLVLCRNLAFTYWVEPLQARILSGILERTTPNARLVLGAHEELPPGDWPLEPVPEGVPVFRRRPARDPARD